MLPISNPITFVFIAATALGVLMHDTQVDQATSMAIVPMHFSDYAMADSTSKSNEHVHVERASISSEGSSTRANTLKIQPRNEDRRYVQSKKYATNGSGSGLWPST